RDDVGAGRRRDRGGFASGFRAAGVHQQGEGPIPRRRGGAPLRKRCQAGTVNATVEHNFVYDIKPVLTLVCQSCRRTEYQARMRFWSKSTLVLGLALWTTGATWLS